MSTDPSGATTGRVELTSRESCSQDDTASLRDLSDLASAIERVAALIVADAAPTADGSDALERLADIAFVLHERNVEASLCDALDAAARELGSAEASRQARAERARQAATSLRALARRVKDMIALVSAEQRPSPAANAAEPMKSTPATGLPVGEPADDEMSGDGLFALDAREDDAFAQGVASLAASGAVFLGEPSLPPTQASKAMPVADVSGNESIGAVQTRPLVDAERSWAPPELQALPDPDEDPGDLFEPLAEDSTVENSSGIPAPTPPPPTVAGVTPQAAPIRPSADPLAPLRALSEEEMIALFS